MKTQKMIIQFFCAIVLLMLFGKQEITTTASPSPASLAQVTASDSSYGGPIIADHTVVSQFSNIPQTYINAVRRMWVVIPGESHSVAYRRGSELLEAQDDRFQVNVRESGTPEAYTDQYMRISRATWGDLSQSSGWIYGYGEEDWYTNGTALSRTQAGITYANTNDLMIAAMGFGWCWDMSHENQADPTDPMDPQYLVHWAGSSQAGPNGNLPWGLNSEDQALTGNPVSMDSYLNAVEQYMAYSAANGYPTQLFFTTGPVEDTVYNQNENGYQSYLKMQYIRDHVLTMGNRILFDYADILTWGDDGLSTSTTWIDYGDNNHIYPYIRPDNMLDLSGARTIDVGHIGERGALRLGKALWWLLARLAGWDGVGRNSLHLASAASGNWNSPATWGGVLPQATDAVTVTRGSVVTVNANAQITALTIEAGGRLVIPAGVTLNVSERFINHGTMQLTRPVNNASVDFEIGDATRSITRYRMASLTTLNNLGNVTVTVRALNNGETCTNGGEHAYARRCFEITSTQNMPATLRLWAFASEMNSLTTPRIYRYANGAWQELMDNFSNGTQGDYAYFQANTPGFSHFLIAQSPNGPTALELLNFRSRVSNDWVSWFVTAGLILAVASIWGARRMKMCQ